MVLLLVYLFITLAISFLCSLLESVLMTTTLSYLTMREDEGYKPAIRFKNYKIETEKPLAAILSLNTIANTIGAAAIGRQSTLTFGSEIFGVISIITTILILICSEIIPKTIGTNYWRKLTGFTANTIHGLIFILYPCVILVKYVTKLIKKEDSEATISREEVLAIANVGEEEGVIEKDENKIIQNIIKLDSVKASDVMTPRVVAAIAPESMTLKEFYDNDDYDHFSRIPVYAESKEYITGYILRSDALEDLAEDKFNIQLSEIKRDIPFFNEDMSIADIWDAFIQHKSQIAIVIDEYGCFQGILTLEDVIETVFGLEIIDENDQFTDMQQYARERWEKRQKRFKTVKLKRNDEDISAEK